MIFNLKKSVFNGRLFLTTLLFAAFWLGGLGIATAQNTKGDRPVSVSSTKRSKGSVKPGGGKARKMAKTSPRNSTYRQQGPWVNNPSTVQGRGDRPSMSPKRMPERSSTRIPASPQGYNPWIHNPSSVPSTSDKPYRSNRTVSGRRIRNTKPDDRSNFYYPSDRRVVERMTSRPVRRDKPSTVRLPSSGKGFEPPRYSDRPYPGITADQRIINRRPSGRPQVNVYPSTGRFVRNTSSTRRDQQTKGKPLKPIRSQFTLEGRKITKVEMAVRSVTGAFVVRQKKNVYWGKIKRNHERVVTDLAGNPLRRLNFRSEAIPLTNRDSIPVRPNTTKRDTPTSYGKPPTYKTATRSGVAWQGDIAGRGPRRRPRDKRVGGRLAKWLTPAVGSRSATPGLEFSGKDLSSWKGDRGKRNGAFQAWMLGKSSSGGGGGSGRSGGKGLSALFGSGFGAFGFAGGRSPYENRGYRTNAGGFRSGKGGEAFRWAPYGGMSAGAGRRMTIGNMSMKQGLKGSAGGGWRLYRLNGVPKAAGGMYRPGRRPLNLGLSAFRYSGGKAGASAGAGVRAPIGSVRPLRPNFNDMRVLGSVRMRKPGSTNLQIRQTMVYRGKDDNLNTAGLVKARKKSPYSTNLQIRQVMVYRGKDDNLNTAGLVKARKKSPFSTNLQIRQVVVYKGKDDNLNTSGNIPVKRRRPQDLQKANSRNPAGRPALGSGLTPFRRKALMDLNGKRLYTHQAGTRSPGEFRKVMYKVRANPNTKLMMKGIASSGLELKEKTHPQSYHSPAWVRLIKGDMRNTVRVIHPSDLANKDIERYTGNIRRNPFRNRFLTADINGTGKMYFRVVTSRPHHAPGNPITIKQGKYVHAPLASRDALMVREPNKAMMKAVQMQANIKMKKTELQDLKTDAAFFKRQEDKEQGPGVKKRSFKNLFARLLGNSDLLSPRLKSKWLNPGYDPREKGLWAK